MLNFTRFLLATILLFAAQDSVSQIHISADTTWQTDQVFSQSVIVDSGVTLTVMEGVQIEFNYVDNDSNGCGDLKVEVNGILATLGNQCKPVRFGPNGSPTNGRKHWKGVHINSADLNDLISYIEIEYADSGMWIHTEMEMNGCFIHHCSGGIMVLDTGEASVYDIKVWDNFGTGAACYGALLEIDNGRLWNNGKFGIANHGGDLAVYFATVDSNGWGGVYMGSGLNDMSDSHVSDNVGAGFELSEWIYTNDFDSNGVKSSEPDIIVNDCNIFGNSSTQAWLGDSIVQQLVNIIQPWGDCVGGYPALSQGQCKNSAAMEVPFGSFDTLAPEIGHLIKFSTNPWQHYHFTYKLRRDYNSSVYQSVTTNSNGTNCLVSTTIKHVLEPSTFIVNGWNDMYDWEVCALASFSQSMRPTLMDGWYSMKAGSYEVSSTVGASHSIDFQDNWWGTTNQVGLLINEVDQVNVDFNNWQPSLISGAGSSFPSGFPTVNLGPDSTICPDQYANLDAGNAGSIFSWSTGDSTQTIDSLNQAGFYWVDVDNGCGVVRDSFELQLHPAAAVTAAGAADICQGESTLLTASGAATYIWDNGVGAGDSVSVSPNVTTTYQVVGTSQFGCDATDSVTVSVFTVDTSVSLSGIILTSNDTTASYQWINCDDNSAIPGATNNSFTPTESGSYAVVVSRGPCVDTSECHSVTLVSAAQPMAAQEFALYPNPGSDIVNIKMLKGASSGSISIENLLGADIKRIEFHSATIITTDMSDLAEGTYFIRIQTTTATETFRFVKQ